MSENDIGEILLRAAMKVHSALGPGLLESAYEACLAHEIERQGVEIKRQVMLPLKYEGVYLDAGYRLDLLIDGRVIAELKSIEKILPIHAAQLMS